MTSVFDEFAHCADLTTKRLNLYLEQNPEFREFLRDMYKKYNTENVGELILKVTDEEKKKMAPIFMVVVKEVEHFLTRIGEIE